MEILGQSYLDLYELDKALKVYRQLIAFDGKNISHFIAISKIYLDLGEYSESIRFADKAVSLSDTAESYYNRAQIYKGIVESCVAEELTMSDKAVYEMGWQDLNTAASKGHKKAKKQSKFYSKNNLITQFEDWFKLSGKPSSFKPKGKCYSIIKKSIRKRDFKI